MPRTTYISKMSPQMATQKMIDAPNHLPHYNLLNSYGHEIFKNPELKTFEILM